ncbi:leucine-rich repeat-containing protein 15 [Xenopus laevis]|uniref:Leucine-rich repeat-containing protein 15 n=2 Tax=Xenopus laevis TaxID=8355 RepID=A0A1L8GNX1_XENLA|nr:leucine-rich repeat-containing protein 15 [Xenopus laevis]OCT85509.1 hypothetical protein XELAEV_18023678mg [Xenopus laevis]
MALCIPVSRESQEPQGQHFIPGTPRTYSGARSGSHHSLCSLWGPADVVGGTPLSVYSTTALCRAMTMKCFHLLVLLLAFQLVSAIPAIPQCLENCTCLTLQQHVLCGNASLTSVPSNVPNNTVELHLQNNFFSELHDHFLQDLPELRGLYLSNCGINNIDEDAFQSVKSISYLHLDRNRLGDLQEGTFSNLSSLIYLHLESNQITSIREGLFAPLKKLSALYLSNNLLQELTDGSLNGLTQLRWLDLGFNMISRISNQSFSAVTNLRKLNLERNNLTGVPWAIRRKSGLQMLRLSGNGIKRLSSSSFGRSLRFITELYLDSLGLEKLTSMTFMKLRLLKELDLRNNSLQSLSVSKVKIFTKIYLTGNPWRCDCSLIGLHTRLQQAKNLDVEQQAQCDTPKALKGQSLINISLLKLTCPVLGEDVPVTPSTPISSEPNGLAKTSIRSVMKTMKPTTVAYKISPKPTPHPTAGNNKIEEEVQDPCLAEHISNVAVKPAEQGSLDVSWSVHGDYKQFEIRYSTEQEKSSLNIVGDLTNIRLYHLHPGSSYRVCIVPQNVIITKCQLPKTRQCADGQTDGVPEQAYHVYSPPKSTSPVVTIGVSVGLVALVAAAIFAVYTLRSHKIQFQRYYNEDRAEGSRKQETDPYKWDGVYENIDDDRHVYVTAASLWGMDNEILDCSLAEPNPLSSVPKYQTL